ncbi:MAG: hypothetical protein AAFP77_31300 [Bacteroidota bacterium]
MTATATPKEGVRATFVRWYEDQLLESGLTDEQVTTKLNLNTPKSLSRRLNNPAEFSGEEFIQFARLFGKDWYTDLVCKFPEVVPVLKNISVDQAFADAKEKGLWWYREAHVA